MSQIWIGTSGYQYRHWRHGVFYPQNLPLKDEFTYYSQIFKTVEINSTFYGIPKETVWENWAARAPADFLYALKVNRTLTHTLKLENLQNSWQIFFAKAQKLREHLGPILFQLPPNFSAHPEKLKSLARVLPKNCRFAFEFRHQSWFTAEIFQILRQNGWALVIMSSQNLPFIPEVTADFVYLRFHGPKQLYRSNYTLKELSAYADLIKNWQAQNLDIYAYFNNDFDGFAPKNALALQKLLT